MGLLDRQIKKSVASAFKGKLLKGTLRRDTVTGLDDRGDPRLGTPATYSVQGFVDDYSEFHRRSAGIPDTDMRVVLIGGLMNTAPEKGDKVVFLSGEWADQWFEVRRFMADPAGAHYECQAFSVGNPDA